MGERGYVANNHSWECVARKIVAACGSVVG
jgi:hypothetical protein